MESFSSQPEQPQPAQPARRGSITTGGIQLQGWGLASVLIGLMLTLLLSALDQTIVGTALPTIIRDLHGADRYIWPTTAYLVASTTMIPIVGKLSDMFGRKWFLIAGVVIFLIGSALSGASQSMNQLIGFRALQGVGGGILLSLVFTLVGDIFPPAERARWQGLFTAVFALASVIGPAAGGFITDHYTWRWIFYVNVPVGILALVMLVFRLPANISARNKLYRGWAAIRRIDFLGAITAAAATVSLLLGLTWGGALTYAWTSPQVVGTLGGAAVLFLVFFIVERVAVEPILPLDLFKNRVFAVGALLALTVGMALFAVALYLPLFIQEVLGDTATSSGAAITPLTVTMAIGAAIVGQVIAKVGRYQFAAIIGALIMAGGAYLLTQMTSSTSLIEVTRNMIVLGLGMGMLQPVMTLAVQNAIPRTRLGVGTGAVTYLRATGSTLGTAILGAVEFSTFSTEVARRLPSGAQRLPARLLEPATLQELLGSTAQQHTVVTQATQGAVQAAVPQAVPLAVQQAEQQAIAQGVAQATANVPPGPHHAQIVAQITQQVTAQVMAQEPQIRAQVTAHITAQVTQQVTVLLNQVFAAATQALAQGIHNAFLVGLGVTGLMIVLSLFLKDVPLQKRAEPAQAGAPATGSAEAVAAGGANMEAAPQVV